MKKSSLTILLDEIDQQISIKRAQIEQFEDLKNTLVAKAGSKPVRKVKRIDLATGVEVK